MTTGKVPNSLFRIQEDEEWDAQPTTPIIFSIPLTAPEATAWRLLPYAGVILAIFAADASYSEWYNVIGAAILFSGMFAVCSTLLFSARTLLFTSCSTFTRRTDDEERGNY